MKPWVAIVGTMLCLAPSAQAHTSGTSYVNLAVQSESRVRVQLDLDLRDLSFLLPLDANHDNALTWAELAAKQRAVETLALEKIVVSSGGVACTPLRSDALSLAEHGDGPFARLSLTLDCNRTHGALQVDYSRWLDFDAGHRALILFTADDGAQAQSIVSQSAPQWRQHQSTSERTWRFFVEGAAHLVAGYDHLAFLAVLLLALARRRQPDAAPRLAPMLRSAALVITAFTLAHSITLALAATGTVTLPSQPVEVIIAASVVLAALLNLFPGAAHHGWKLAFAFGLVHGLGFAGALAELASERIDLLALAAFNVGIETAQLTIAALTVPVIWRLFRGARGARIGIPVASVAVACIAASWLMERI